jgi:hypothetical protein
MCFGENTQAVSMVGSFKSSDFVAIGKHIVNFNNIVVNESGNE